MYITVRQASEKWGISDRRVRVLCSERKIPYDAIKPTDGRYKITGTLIPFLSVFRK